ELLKVPRLGAKAFEQAAGFLRIRDGEHPLDASAVHPESYGIVDAMTKDLSCSVKDLLRDGGLRQKVQLPRYVTEMVGLPKRIALSMKANPEIGPTANARTSPAPQRSAAPRPPAKPAAPKPVDWFTEALNKSGKPKN